MEDGTLPQPLTSSHPHHTTPLNRRLARHHHLLSLSHRIRTSKIMNYLTRSTSICSRAISCMASNIHMTMRKPTQAPAFSFLLFQTCNMGTKAMLKTNKAAAKRIRIRGSGSVKRWDFMCFSFLLDIWILILFLILHVWYVYSLQIISLGYQ